MYLIGDILIMRKDMARASLAVPQILQERISRPSSRNEASYLWNLMSDAPCFANVDSRSVTGMAIASSNLEHQQIMPPMKKPPRSQICLNDGERKILKVDSFDCDSSHQESLGEL
jgi:hypothetical protein